MERLVWLGLLFDFYGELLTPRQRQICQLYFDQDQSLGEIAQQQGVSRQAIHDLLRRATASLETYETQLGLAKRELRRRRVIEGLGQRLRAIRANLAKLPGQKENCQQLEAVALKLQELVEGVEA